MAIAYDTFVKGLDAGQLQGATWSHTVTGSNPALVVHLFANNSDDVVTGVTYNGVSMTKLQTIHRSDYSPQVCYLFYLPGCATGAHSVVVSASTSITNSTAYSVSYTGVSSGAAETSGSASNNNGTATVSVTTVSSGAWLVGAATNFDTTAFTGSTNFTTRGSNTYMNIADSNAASLTPGSNTFAATCTSSHWAITVASLAPVTSNIKTIDGLAKASVKTVDGLAIASVKTWNGLA